MASTDLICLSNLAHYDSLIKGVAGGKLSIAGQVGTLSAVDGTSLGTITLPEVSYSLATSSSDGLLSSSDYSKLASIEADADVNVIEAVTVNGTALTVNSKTVNIDLSDYALKSSVTSAVLYKGTVDAYADLPTDASTGDMYNVGASFTVDGDTYPAGTNVVWNGLSWDPMSGMSTYETASYDDIDAIFA